MTPDLPRETLAHMELWIGSIDATVIKALTYQPLTAERLQSMSAAEVEKLACL